MAKLIQPHGRLQEWVAHENGYFKDEGLASSSSPLRMVATGLRSPKTPKCWRELTSPTRKAATAPKASMRAT